MTKNKAETTDTRQMMVSDLRYLERILGSAHYNSRANLKLREIGFKGYESFPEPNISTTLSRTYLMNNLIHLKELLNTFDLGNKIETETTNTNIPF